MFKVSDHRPLPETQATKYPLSQMRQGQSFFLPGNKRLPLDNYSKNLGKRFAQRRAVEGGVEGFVIFCMSDSYDKPIYAKPSSIKIVG